MAPRAGMVGRMQVSTGTAVSTGNTGLGAALARQPLILLALVVACLPLALATTLTMPIGPMYWDHYIYLDAANRISDGQIPSIDFFAPVGALGYYLFAGWLYLFPDGHPLLLASWSLMTVTIPLMALVLHDVQKRSVATAYGLLLPFLLFSLLPFNTGEFYPYPGSHGFAIYNRQVSQLLYVLAAALVFVRGWKMLAAIASLTMLVLTFVKITGLVAGALLCLTAFLAGRLRWQAAFAAGGFFLAACAAVELWSGLVSAYAGDILSLLEINDSSLLPRLLQAASLNFGIMLACFLLALVLLAQGYPALRGALRAFAAQPGRRTFTDMLDQPFFWLAGFVVAGLVFESQNTGSQAFIFLWPLLLAILVRSYRRNSPARFAVVAVLVLAAALPPALTVVQKSARAWIGILNNRPLEHQHLKSMGAVSARDAFLTRAQRLRENYIGYRDAYEALAAAGELPSFLLTSDYDFQALWLQSADQAVSAVLAYEAANDIRFETIMSIDFTSPFAWLLDRQAPEHIAIGADPTRSVPAADQSVIEAVSAVDIALYPTCPPTLGRLKLLELYEPILASGHTRIKLTPCYDAFLRKGLASQQPG